MFSPCLTNILSRFVLFIFILIVGNQSLKADYIFESKEASELAKKIDTSYKIIKELISEKPSIPRLNLINIVEGSIMDIEHSFINLPRSVPIEDIAELRYALVAWRMGVEESLFYCLQWYVFNENSRENETINKEVLRLRFLYSILRALRGINGLMPMEHLSTLAFWAQNILKNFKEQELLDFELASLFVEKTPPFDNFTDQPPPFNRLIEKANIKKTILKELEYSPNFTSQKSIPRIVPCERGDCVDDDFKNWSKQQAFIYNIFPLDQNLDHPLTFLFYKNIDFQNGDIILIDQSINFDTGMNTTFSIPRSLFSHMGVYVTLHDEKGHALPSVVEIADKGLRAVPLSIYVGPNFSHYSEVFRRVNRPKDYDTIIENWANKNLNKPYRYDFYAQEMTHDYHPNCINCSSEEAKLCIDCGFTPIKERSLVAEGIKPTLRQLGLDLLADRGTYLTPTDYRRSKDFSLVGVIDNRAPHKSLAKELVAGSEHVPGTLGYTLSHYNLVEERLPKLYFVKVSLMENILKGNSFALMAAGFKGHEANFPQAPAKALAFITTIGDYAKKSILETAENIQKGNGESGKYIHDSFHALKRFSLHEVETDIRVRKDVQKLLEPVEKWFGPSKIGN